MNALEGIGSLFDMLENDKPAFVFTIVFMYAVYFLLRWLLRDKPIKETKTVEVFEDDSDELFDYEEATVSVGNPISYFDMNEKDQIAYNEKFRRKDTVIKETKNDKPKKRSELTPVCKTFKVQGDSEHEKESINYEALVEKNDISGDKSKQKGRQIDEEIRWLKDNSIADPAMDAMADIEAGKPMHIVVGTGYAGYKTLLEEGSTFSLDNLRIKYSFGRIGCTGPATSITSDDELYARIYNQTILNNLSNF